METGCSDSLASMNISTNKLKKSSRKFATGNGIMRTTHESEISFTLPEFSDTKLINWNFNIFQQKNIGYDIIIGRDLMQALKIDISFQNETICWEGIEIPMRDYHRLRKWNLSKHEMHTIIQEMREPISTKTATDRMIKRRRRLKRLFYGIY